MSHHISRTHHRSPSEGPRLKLEETDLMSKIDLIRTESPDNDSAFSDTVSMLSSESSASSGGSGSKPQDLHIQNLQGKASRIKTEKIRMAMEKIKEANIQKLFLKVFTADGSAKSLLVDEKMICSFVTRLLMDKNHVETNPKWAIVEHLPELYIERIYEDHERLVENLMMWTRDSKNKIFFSERSEKNRLFVEPEKFLLSMRDKKDSMDFDEHSRHILLEEFFSNTSSVPEVEGPLYLKADSKKGWKKYHFVLRASGLYYYPKEKVKSVKDLVCLAAFENNQIYYGFGWKKKYKAPTDFGFAIKHPRLQEPKSTKFIKYLCAEDQSSLEWWMVGMRIAKYGKQLMENYRTLMDELAQEDLDMLAHARSCSVSSIAVQSNTTTLTQGYQSSEAGYGTQSETYSAPSEVSSGIRSRASSSSSSGCMSDGAPSSCENAFDSEFSMGTIKRKPSMKPSLPLTNITRQLKEVGETKEEVDNVLLTSPICSTNSDRHSQRKSGNSDDSSNSGTLKRQHLCKSRGSLESMRTGNSTPFCDTPARERTFADKSCPFGNRIGSGIIRGPMSNTNTEMPPCMTDSITFLPPPPETNGHVITDSISFQLPPPHPEVFNSTLSLNSLPPPPNSSELTLITGTELTGSQLSLMSLPPPPGETDTSTIPRRKDSIAPTKMLSPERTPTMSLDLTPTQSRLGTPTCFNSSLSNCSLPTKQNPLVSFCGTPPACVGLSTPPPYVSPPCYKQSNTLPGSSAIPLKNVSGLRSSLRQTSLPRQISQGEKSNSINGFPHLQRKPNSSSPKKSKKISFNLVPQEVPPLTKKPPPPKRSESTKLSSPKKLVEPSVDFLKDLQRVMRKKWQVAQKCKLEPTTTPHEVLGFRDPPAALPDYKEHNVSNWVQEHYGPHNLYENVYKTGGDVEAVAEYAASPVHYWGRRPPPPLPKRSETTHLSTPKAMH